MIIARKIVFSQNASTAVSHNIQERRMNVDFPWRYWFFFGPVPFDNCRRQKKEFSKKLSFTFNREILLAFLVLYVFIEAVIKLMQEINKNYEIFEKLFFQTYGVENSKLLLVKEEPPILHLFLSFSTNSHSQILHKSTSNHT